MSLGKVAQSVMPPTLSERPLILAEHPFLHAELPLKLFARRDTVIANHEISVSSHETVISCPAFPIMVISVMINSCSAPLGTKTPIAASTRYGLVLAAIGRVGCCVVAEVCRESTSFCCVVAGLGSGGVDGSVHNLAQRFHDEVALVHQRVGNVQVGLVDV